jgi:hypothetical protein
MLVNPKPIRLSSARDVNRHLDEWAGDHLTGPDPWSEVLAATRDWSDYSARNQLLLATHGANGPVAGLETWRLMPTGDGGNCVVRSGEHGLPVRVPVTTTAAEPDPHLGRARPTSAAVQGWEWRGVFCLEQLARRPNPDMLVPADHSDLVDRPALLAAAMATAKRTLRGKAPELDDPFAVLVEAAGRLPRTSDRPGPGGARAEQAAWLTLDRVGHAEGALAEFDPAGLAVRERWESLLDVLDVERRMSAAFGQHVGVDLLATRLPRMEIDDDRVVPAGRRNRLPRASLQQLPVGRWVEVGPYTSAEWAARGEDATGKGTYLRLNTTAYLVAVERGDRATWRLEDTRAKTGAGRLDGGDEPNLDAAQATAFVTLRHRYPQLADITPDLAAPAPTGTRTGWETVPEQAGTMRHIHHGDVVTYVLASGDRWTPILQRTPTGAPEAIATPVANRDEAMSMCDLAGRRAVREAQLESRVGFDDSIAELATSPTYTHDLLVERVGTRLAEPEQVALAANPTATELVELLGAAGVTPTTTVAVLRAEEFDVETVAPLLAVIGIPPADAIRVLNAQWGIARVEAAEHLGATAAEMRAAGCTATEIIAARPREVIATLAARPDLWDLAGGTLAVTGHQPDEIAGVVATHAPNPDCFAAAMAAAVDDATLGVALAVRRGMPAEALVALSERYGMSPTETAVALGAANATPHLTVRVLFDRCDADAVLTTQVARSTLQLRTDTVIAALGEHEPLDTAEVSELRAAPRLSRDRDALIAANQPPRPQRPPPATRTQAAVLLHALPPPEGETTPGGRPALLAGLPDPDLTCADDSLLASLPEPDLPHELTEIDQ